MSLLSFGSCQTKTAVMTLFWSKLFYKCTVMTLFRHNIQPKCATITLFPHMPFFRHQRVLHYLKCKAFFIFVLNRNRYLNYFTVTAQLYKITFICQHIRRTYVKEPIGKGGTEKRLCSKCRPYISKAATQEKVHMDETNQESRRGRCSKHR